MLSVNLFVPDSGAALSFYANVFNAVNDVKNLTAKAGERFAVFYINGHRFAVADENPGLGSKCPLTLGGVPMCIQLYVDDLEEVIRKALSEGGTVCAPGTKEAPIFTAPDKSRCCNIRDPFGFVWSLTQILDRQNAD